MSELESVQRDPEGRVFCVGVEGRALYYLPRVIAELDELRAENGRFREAHELQREFCDAMTERGNRFLAERDEARSELAAARRVVQAVPRIAPSVAASPTEPPTPKDGPE